MPTIQFFIIASFVVLCDVVPAENVADSSATEAEPRQRQLELVQDGGVRKPLHYLLYSPKKDSSNATEQFPLVLFLHGGGEGGSDLNTVKRHGLPKLISQGNEFPFFVASPQNPSKTQFWDDQQLILLLDQLVEEYPVDETRIYLVGMSRGAFGAWRLAIQNPDRFAALIPISGGGPLPYVDRLKDVPVWAFHGEKDPLIPVSESKRLVKQLQSIGGNAKLTVYPDLEHDAWTRTFENPDVYSWLQKQRNGKAIANAVRADGYKGIWFTLGQFYGPGDNAKGYAAASKRPTFPYGDKYSGGLGTYTAKHTPLAVYCEEVSKTFFVYGGTSGAKQRSLRCMISFYDHESEQVPRPVIVHDKHPVDDPHDNPSLAVDKDGHLWVFVSGRGKVRPGYLYRSVKPYSIDRFEQVHQKIFTYPQPHVTKDRGLIHLFTKYTGVRELYWGTSSDGRSWSDDFKLAGMRENDDSRGGHYQTSASHANRVGTFFNRHPNGSVDRRTDLYYAQTNDMGVTWTDANGTSLQIPMVDVDCSAKVIDYASKGLNVYLKDMGFDESGNPAVLYLTSSGHQPGFPNGPRSFCITRWDGTEWQTTKICETDHNYDMGSLFINKEDWSVYIPSSAGPQPHHSGGEIHLWQSKDRGQSWTRTRQVTRNSPKNHNYVRRPINATDPFFTFWTDGDPTNIGESHLYFGNSDGTKVWQLPYHMDGEIARPTLMQR